jgi:alcohol dehydrogenase YqhD (iron-dependent ADH family)
METISKLLQFALEHSDVILQIMGAIGILKWFQSDMQKRAQQILTVADAVFDAVEIGAKEFGWSSGEKWARFFDSVTTKLRLAGIEMRETEIRRLEKMVQERAKIAPKLHITKEKESEE